LRLSRSDGEVIDIKTEVDAFAVGIEPVEEAWVVGGTLIFI
jgi:hypothetical protein